MAVGDGPAARGARVCAVAVLGAVLCFSAWQWVMPPGFESVRGLNQRAVWEWRGAVGLSLAPAEVAAEPYRLVFRALLVLMWVAYAGLLWFVVRGGRLGRGWTWPLAVPLVATLAVAVPAALSTDVFAYVGYARLGVVHGLNPHLHSQAELLRLGDPSSPYLRWPIPSPYGPLWTLVCMAVVSLCRWLGGGVVTALESTAGAILAPVLALKLVAGGGLLVAAGAARAAARRIDPARAPAVFVLVVLNPLLLIEGPGNGHNDLVMVALLLAGVAALGVGRARTAALAIGTAAAIKLLPLLLVPWLAILAVRDAVARGRSRVAAVAVTVLLALAPVVASYAPLWEGGRSLGGIVARWEKGDPSAVSGSPAKEREGIESGRSRLGDLLRGLWRVSPALLIYVWATLAIAFGQGDPAYRLATLWSFLALGILCFAAGLWCSWYLAWLWPPVVPRFTRPHMLLAAFVVPFSLLLMLAYATPPG